jgi:anthranilate phosphoribosyltransferase
MWVGDFVVTAFVLCVTDAGKEREVVEKLRSMEKVEEAHVVYGEYDVIAKIIVDELKQLDSFISEKVRVIKEIQMTSTMIAI